MATEEPRIASALFGYVGAFPLSMVEAPPGHAWTVGEDAQCAMLDPVTGRWTRRPVVTDGERDGCTAWHIPDEGLLEYFQFAHRTQPHVSGVLRLSHDAEPIPLAPWSPECVASPRLRDRVEHLRLYRLLTACGLPVPGSGNEVYAVARTRWRSAKGGATDYTQETYHLLAAAAHVDEVDPGDAVQMVEDEWVSQYGTLPKGLGALLGEARGIIEGITPVQARWALSDWAGTKTTPRQRVRRTTPTLEFGR
ncbi:MAG: hypothetical protein ACYCZN_02100 [Candidatus Dormibacteria bacterium]